MMTKFKIENSSFRDTSGFLFHQDDILYRLIHTSYKEQFDHLINSELYKKLSEKNLLIAHEEISDLKLDYDYYKIIKNGLHEFLSTFLVKLNSISNQIEKDFRFYK